MARNHPKPCSAERIDVKAAAIFANVLQTRRISNQLTRVASDRMQALVVFPFTYALLARCRTLMN